MTKRELIAWAAGFYEGEGSISCWRNSWRIQVKNTDRSMLERFLGVVGRGQIRGPYQHGPDKPIYLWDTGRSDDINEVATLLWEFLSERRHEQIIDAMIKREEYLMNRSEWGKARADAISESRRELPSTGVK